MRAEFDLHIHSDASFDGRMSAEEIKEKAKAAGLRGVAICDHDVSYGGACEEDGFIIIPGEEFSTEHGHLLGLFLTSPIKTGMSFEETADAIHSQGGLAVLAHPFERSTDAGRLLPLLPLLDGIEVYNGRAERKIKDANKRAKKFAEENGKREFAGSDAHLPREIGNGIITVETPSLTLSAVKEALMNNPVSVSGKRGKAVYVARSQLTKLKKTKAPFYKYIKWLVFAAKCRAEDLFKGDR